MNPALIAGLKRASGSFQSSKLFLGGHFKRFCLYIFGFLAELTKIKCHIGFLQEALQTGRLLVLGCSSPLVIFLTASLCCAFLQNLLHFTPKSDSLLKICIGEILRLVPQAKIKMPVPLLINKKHRRESQACWILACVTVIKTNPLLLTD